MRPTAHALLCLDYALREGEALTALTQMQLSRAQQLILGAAELLDSFPGLLGHLRPCLLMLAGARQDDDLPRCTSDRGSAYRQKGGMPQPDSWRCCAGHYAHALGLFEEAAERFGAASEAASGARKSSIAAFAALNQALVLVHSGEPSAGPAAMEVLKRHGLFHDANPSLPSSCR